MLLGTDPNTYVPLHLIIAGLEFNSFVTNITAHAGGGQASAVQLTAELNNVTTVATAGDSVKLPSTLGPTGGPAVGGLTVTIINSGANPMQVYGLGTDTINGVAAATGVSQMPNSTVVYSSTDQGKWEAQDIGTGYFGSLPTYSSQNALTAHAGGGQASATPITASQANFTTVATLNDSAVLPATTGLPNGCGLEISVANNGAANMAVFPATGDKINGLAVNTAITVNAGTITIFYSFAAGQWWTK